MIIAAYDGRNINTVFDAVELKVINEFLKRINATQVADVANAIANSGFGMTTAECAAIATAVNGIAGKLLDTVNTNNAEVESNEAEDGPDVTAGNAQPRKRKPTVN